jgi:hypothetical protein
MRRRARELTLRDVQAVYRDRHLRVRFDENTPAMYFDGVMPATDGAELIKTLTRLASQAPASQEGLSSLSRPAASTLYS